MMDSSSKKLLPKLAHHISTPTRIEIAYKVLMSLKHKLGSFTKVAKELNISRTTLYIWLRGEMGPSDFNLGKLLGYVDSRELISILELDLRDYLDRLEEFKKLILQGSEQDSSRHSSKQVKLKRSERLSEASS